MTVFPALLCLATTTFAPAPVGLQAGARLKGNIQLVVGTVVSNVPPSSTAQTVSLNINGKVTKYSALIMDDRGLVAGDSASILLKDSVILQVPVAAKAVKVASYNLLPKTVPVSATNGALTSNVAISGNYTSVQVIYPSFTIGNYSFPNGGIVNFSENLPTSYDIELPTTSKRDTEGTAVFGAGSNIPIGIYCYFGSGQENALMVEAVSGASPVTLGAHLTGNFTKSYSFTLRFGRAN